MENEIYFNTINASVNIPGINAPKAEIVIHTNEKGNFIMRCTYALQLFERVVKTKTLKRAQLLSFVDEIAGR